MTTIQEQRTLLTQPFPAEYIQTVPKAGRNLQYVSHGRVTERLNDVDPEIGRASCRERVLRLV